MSKRNKIVYWVATIWLSLGMVSVVQVIHMKETQFILELGIGISHPAWGV